MPKRSKAGRLEYRLLITPQFNERRQQHTTLFLLETTQFFATFQYELSVDTRIGDHEILLRVLGLKAPDLSLPAVGHARFSREFDDLHGNYELTVEGLDGRSNSFSVRIAADRVQLVKSPGEKFVEIVVDRKLWPTT